MSFGDTQKPAIHTSPEAALYESVGQTAGEMRRAIETDPTSIGSICDMLLGEEEKGLKVEKGKAALVMALTHMLADTFDALGDQRLARFTPFKNALKGLSDEQKLTIQSGFAKAALVEEPILVPAAVAERTAVRQTLAMLVSL